MTPASKEGTLSLQTLTNYYFCKTKEKYLFPI